MTKLGPESGAGFHVTEEEAARFWQRVEKGPNCWTWLGACNKSTGYGAFTIYRVRQGPLAAHRVSYAIQHGAAPSRTVIMHSCDNVRCVNPAHLSPGSQRDNSQDMVKKGRHGSHKRRGRRAPCRACGASREGCPRGRVCASCHEKALQFRAGLSAEKARSSKMVRDLRVIPPSDYATLSAFVGERHAEMMTRYFGLYDTPMQVRSAIAEGHGVTPQRVSQLVEVAQRRLLSVYSSGAVPVWRSEWWRMKAA